MERELLTRADELRGLLEAGDLRAAVQLLGGLHPADAADVVLELEEDERVRLLPVLGPERVAHILEHLDPEDRGLVVRALPIPTLSRVLDRTDNDVAADVLLRLPPADGAMVLNAMATARDVAPLLIHAEESAGALMTRGFVTLREEMSAEEAIEYLRLVQPEAEHTYYLYVVDAENRLRGVLSLRHLVIAPAEARIGEIMSRDVISVGPQTDQEEALRVLQRYDLLALPVVDEEGRLVGVTTVDDLLDVAEEEATEDMFRLAGLNEDESAYLPLGRSVRLRLPWLALTLFVYIGIASVVSAFEGSIRQAAVLASFMPVISALGGNAGIQTLTLMVRSIAVGEVQLRDTVGLLVKQLATALANGLLLAVAVAVITLVWRGNLTLALILGAAMLFNVALAGLLGVLMPVLFRAVRMDPALASGIFLTTLMDLLGFLFFLGLGTVFLSRLS